MAQIIGISGKARSGKDSLFAIAAKDGFVRLSFAEELKSRIRRDFPFLTTDHTDGDLKEIPMPQLSGHTPRELMIDYGTHLFRKYDNDYWVKAMVTKLRSLPSDAKVMITDVRFPNEAAAVHGVGGKLIRLERHHDRDTMVSEATKQSVSETALDDFAFFDFVLKDYANRNIADLECFWCHIAGQMAERTH